MALNIEIEGFSYLSDTESKLSPVLKAPISPIESESSGISSCSLDSDDLKKQLLSSPTISHDENEDPQSSDGGDTKEEEEEEEDEDEEDREAEEMDDESDNVKLIDQIIDAFEAQPTQIMYQNRDITEMGHNVDGSQKFVNYATLPETNVQMFFQNRAQYWRLGANGECQEYSLEKCPCCDFTSPISQQLNQGQMATNGIISSSKNAMSESILTFLKSTNEYMTQQQNQHHQSHPSNNQQHQKRMFNNNNNNNNTPFGYQMHQQQHPYQNNAGAGGGFYNNNNNNNNNTNFQMNSSYGMGNGGVGGGGAAPPVAANNYSNTAMTLLSLMNSATRNAAGAFQAMNNNSRMYGNGGSNSNNNWGHYKQF